MNKYLFCLDAGFANTGMSLFKVNEGKFILQSVKTVQTKKSDKKKSVRVADDDSERIKYTIKEIQLFIEPYLDGKIMAAIELPTGGAQGARANRTMGMITGALVTYLEIMGWAVEYVTPNDVKMIIAGNRQASKDEIMNKIREKLKQYSHLFPKTKNEFEHIADSIGVAMYIKKYSEMFKILVK